MTEHIECNCHAIPIPVHSTAHEIKVRLEKRTAQRAYDQAYCDALEAAGSLSRYQFDVAVCALLDTCKACGIDPFLALSEGRKR